MQCLCMTTHSDVSEAVIDMYNFFLGFILGVQVGLIVAGIFIIISQGDGKK